jgi:dTDP-4-dehydrorhamnose 3,5-epimerase
VPDHPDVVIQDNQSKSQYGVIRGLHYQKNPHAQTKLVQVVQGLIYDVAVDMRKNSPTFGRWFGIELSETNKLQLFIPKGFAHGFSVQSKTAVVFYKCDTLYNPKAEAGVRYDDTALKIDWRIPSGHEIISEKDKKLESFATADNNFFFDSSAVNITQKV